MAELLLESLEIRNFRLFRHLKIERLGRVNLFVGKNNVGKSALLEALWLYRLAGSPSVIWDLLEARKEGRRPEEGHLTTFEQVLALRHLFFGRPDIFGPLKPIQIGSSNGLKGISVDVEWVDEPDSLLQNSLPLLDIRTKPNGGVQYRLDQNYQWWQPSTELVHSVLVPAPGLDEGQFADLWDNIALTDSEEAVIEALRLIAPNVRDVNLVGGQDNRPRLPFVRISGSREPIPLHSMGEGMPRLFGLILALVNSEGGLLLVDEIERGFHYSVQPDLWRLVFETAQRLNVQVFATTHSWDCIEAFQQAAQENRQEEGMLISLRRRRDDPEQVVAVLYGEDELGIATRDQLEVR